ncbi:Mef2, mitochondrial translation elongation factor EF-G [Tribonema minus]|uniref:Mef2, mitochondrial translation elongation factor EF-G n=1 Tax=Tribonema minus TaxID=303371 RepID=A0A835ZDB5_9STRA|nr:Mef2, mitochondrial translation elongation factor EF-G [Tribonema minus]
MRLIRNLGIIAHIDAGKTTTTERMLYIVGDTRHQGSVDTGDTVTDFMPQERERGITIQSAAVSVEWNGHHVNLIDTPGHVDFSIEVERAVRVLDGAVLVLDAVAGVQAQTETVWRTATSHNVPAIAFVNKMDRQGADFNIAVQTLRNRLGVTPLPIQLPIGSEGGFKGAVDLIAMEGLVYQPGGRWEGDVDTVELRRVALGELEGGCPGLSAAAAAARAELLMGMAEADEAFMDTYLSEGEAQGAYDVQTLLGALRRICLAQAGIPVLCGAALRGIGVEPLLDSAIAFLPSPLDRPPATGVLPANAGGQGGVRGKRGKKGRKVAAAAAAGGGAGSEAWQGGGGVYVTVDPLCDKLVALAFKVTHDRRREPLVFVRVYSGELHIKQPMLNATARQQEKAMQLMQVHADDYRSISTVTAGQVAAIVGLHNTRTGDTLTDQLGPYAGLQLSGVNIPEAVFSVAVEPDLSSQEATLEAALAIICREDPSVRFEADKDTGQTILRGIGELHLEVVCDRLGREFNVPVQQGRVYIAYREGISHAVEVSDDYDREREVLPGRRMYAGLDLQLELLPEEEQSGPCEVELSETVLDELSAGEADELLRCLDDACGRGPVGGYPLMGARVTVTAVRKDADTSPGAVRYAAATIVRDAAIAAGAVLLEPVMACEVAVPPSHLGSVLSDLTTHRRAIIKEVDTSAESPAGASTALDRYTLHASVPLRELVGYASSLRALTAGEASFSMHLTGYAPMDPHTAKHVLKDGY